MWINTDTLRACALDAPYRRSFSPTSVGCHGPRILGVGVFRLHTYLCVQYLDCYRLLSQARDDRAEYSAEYRMYGARKARREYRRSVEDKNSGELKPSTLAYSVRQKTDHSHWGVPNLSIASMCPFFQPLTRIVGCQGT